MAQTRSTNSPVTEIAVAVVEHGGHFIVGIRPRGVPLAGYSEFPGGKVDEGETPDTAACRECEEETGLTVRACGNYGEVLHAYAHGTVRIHFINCRPDNPNLEPRAPFRWVPRMELLELSFPEANANLILQLANDVSLSDKPGSRGNS